MGANNSHGSSCKKLIPFENTLDLKREQLRIKEEAALKKEAVYKAVVVKKLSKKHLAEHAVNKGKMLKEPSTASSKKRKRNAEVRSSSNDEEENPSIHAFRFSKYYIVVVPVFFHDSATNTHYSCLKQKREESKHPAREDARIAEMCDRVRKLEERVRALNEGKLELRDWIRESLKNK